MGAEGSGEMGVTDFADVVGKELVPVERIVFEEGFEPRGDRGACAAKNATVSS